MKLKFVGNGPFGSTTRKNSSAYYLREEELFVYHTNEKKEDLKKLGFNLVAQEGV